MSINRKLGDLANVLDDGTEGQVLSFNASGVIAASDIAAGASVYDSAALLPLSGLSAGDMAYVTGTNRFYISNGTGWYSVSLINTNPSITSVQDSAGGITPFTLTTDGTATVITVTASDPEEVPLTYNYSVTSGSLTNGGGTTATVTQVDNVFTITPSTTEAYAGTFELTFTASDGINQDTSANSFTLEFITLVTNSNYTTLLATATGTSDNNNITDASTNSHTITVNGDTYAGTFSPYRSGGYSTHLETQTSRYATNTSSDFDIGGTGDWSYEAWIYADNQTWPSYPRAFGLGPYYSDPKTFGVLLKDPDNSNAITVYWDDAAGQGRKLISTTTFSQGVWHHLATCRSGNNIALFLDGTRIAHNSSYTSAIDAGNTWLYVGHTGNNTEGFQGYVRDVRFINGSHPYDASVSSITVPTETLTKTANTKFLSSTLPYLTDISDTGHSLTVSGNVSTKPFSPYDYVEYAATNHGGSVYFDGTGDYLDTNSAINFSGGGCIEGWVYITSATSYAFFIASTQGAGNFEPRWYVGHGVAGEWRVSAGDAITNNLTSYDLIKNQWNHFVLSNDGSRSRLFVNGVLIFTKSVTPLNENLTFTLSKYGPYAQYLMTGNLSDVRVTTSIPTEYQTSSTTVGSSIFTPPTAPLSSSGAALHIKGTDASIIDKSQGANLKLFGNTTGSTTQAKFANTKSMYFDGTGDYITLDGTFDDFLESGTVATIELWGRLVSTTPRGTILSNWYNNNGWSIDYDNNHYIHIAYNTTTYYFVPTPIPSFNAWNHYAIVNNGSNITCFINGVLIGSSLNNLTVGANSTGYMMIGQRHDGTLPTQGYIQDLRITKGLARYTANFTPPTASLEG